MIRSRSHSLTMPGKLCCVYLIAKWIYALLNLVPDHPEYIYICDAASKLNCFRGTVAAFASEYSHTNWKGFNETKNNTLATLRAPSEHDCQAKPNSELKTHTVELIVSVMCNVLCVCVCVLRGNMSTSPGCRFYLIVRAPENAHDQCLYNRHIECTNKISAVSNIYIYMQRFMCAWALGVCACQGIPFRRQVNTRTHTPTSGTQHNIYIFVYFCGVPASKVFGCTAREPSGSDGDGWRINCFQ